MRHLLRAAARIARSFPEPLLGLGLLQHFRTASPPRIDEPIADLCTVVSSLAPASNSRTNLRHGETGARAEYLLLFLGGIGMSEVFLEPLFKHVGNVPGKIASSLLWRLRRHVFRLELHWPVIAVLVLMSIVTRGYLVAV